MKYDFLIVGAGLFGSICAYELGKRNFKCLVIDKRSHIGGNVYTEKIKGIDVHKYGAHIFHTSDRNVWNYINKFSEFNNYINSPIANYKGELYNLPFNMNTFYQIWGVKTPKEAQQKIHQQRKETLKISNLEEQAISLVGRDIYEKLIKGYTEKQWGKKCSELPPNIIKRLPVRFTFDNNYFDDAFQGIPTKGYTEIIKQMLKFADVKTNVNFKQHKKELLKISRKVIYTGPIDEYYDYEFGELEYRSLMFKHYTLPIKNYQGNAVINFTDSETPYTRIIEHKHFNKSESDNTIITKEFPISWNRNREAYYPVNDETNQKIFQKYKKLSESENDIFFGGRLGNYQYINMDECIKQALSLVEKLIKMA